MSEILGGAGYGSNRTIVGLKQQKIVNFLRTVGAAIAPLWD